MTVDPDDPDTESDDVGTDADETVGPFESPPLSFVDADDRRIDVEVLSDDPAEVGALVSMYESFDTAERAQGLPPVGEGPIREWLGTLVDQPESCNVIARHGEDVIGHATLVADGGDAHELAIFVHQSYQGAGIGTRLMYALLGHGRDCGVEEVWLTVERWNRAAVSLYEKIGFERVGRENFTIEMTVRISPSPAATTDGDPTDEDPTDDGSIHGEKIDGDPTDDGPSDRENGL